jgi:hypothetical protein
LFNINKNKSIRGPAMFGDILKPASKRNAMKIDFERKAL